ncbi:MAG TPA: DUF6314 family protein [Stellaceae bacterium]|nr:DUF6314 family protein [Stellaceae bacterium]
MRDLRRFLAGRWRLARRIEDRRLALAGSLRGRVTLTPAGGGLDYAESGTLSFGSWRGEATQRYRFLFDGAQVAVCFADGRLFHRCDLSLGRAEVAHACSPDRYQGRYRILDADRWALSWRITGPRKDLVIGSVYTRLDEG